MAFFVCLSILNISSYSLLPCRVSAEKSTGCFIRIHVIKQQDIKTIKILSLSFESLVIMNLDESLFGLNMFGILELALSEWPYISPDLGSFQLIFFKRIFPSPSPSVPLVGILQCEYCFFLSHSSLHLRFFSSFFNSHFFAFLWLDNVKRSAFKLIDSFFCLLS